MDPPIQITSSSGCGEKIKILFFSFPAGKEVIFSLNIYRTLLFVVSTDPYLIKSDKLLFR